MPTEGDEVRLVLRSEVDVLRARKEGQRLAGEIGLNAIDTVKVATAISEIASNAVFHAESAALTLRVIQEEKRQGLLVVVADKGPGIPDVDAALEDGFSTRRSLGIGLGAAKRLMDGFDIETATGKGTTVTMTKWKP